MINSYTIFIEEIDDTDLAVSELEIQLIEIKLLKNSVGIVAAHPDFVRSGVYAAVSQACPFLLVGATALAQSAGGKSGMYAFTILILTSDDAVFTCGYSDATNEHENVEKLTMDFYNSLKEKAKGPVKLVLLYCPTSNIQTYPGLFINAITRTDPKVPIFGAVASADSDHQIGGAHTLCGQHNCVNCLAMLLISGNVSPEFYIGHVKEGAVFMPQMGQVTASKGNLIQEINNMSVKSFFEKMSFEIGSNRVNRISSIFLIKNQNTQGLNTHTIARDFMSLSEEGCYVAGAVPVNSVLSLAVIKKEEVMETLSEVVDTVTKDRESGILLMYSCVGRRYALLNEPMKEFEYIDSSIPKGINYLTAYSFGEICPTYVSDEHVYNNEHNYTLVSMYLK